MNKVIIGLDTSCYTTSCAAVTPDGQIVASARKLLPVAAGERGLRQSEAVYHHVRQLPEIMAELGESLRAAGAEIAAVSVSDRPRDGEDSYMPVFRVGEAFGRSMASALGVPCFASTHQRGHIAAAAVDSGIDIDAPMLALHLSGGTTELLSLDRDQTLTLLGGTLDLHGGQLVDRTGVAMGLPFPAGPSLEKLAVMGTSRSLLPVSMAEGGLYCHLSGAETRVQQWIREGTMPREDIAREVYDFLARTICRLFLAAGEKTGIRQGLAAGGVASSALFRQLLTGRLARKDRDFRICFGRPEYSGDNAVGAALLGAGKYSAGLT